MREEGLSSPSSLRCGWRHWNNSFLDQCIYKANHLSHGLLEYWCNHVTLWMLGVHPNLSMLIYTLVLHLIHIWVYYNYRGMTKGSGENSTSSCDITAPN